MFRKMPFILLSVMLGISFFESYLSLPVKSFLYAISLSIKSLILFVLPLVIFGLLFKTSVNLAKRATKTILLLAIGICLSNFISTLLSYRVGSFVYQLDLSMKLPTPEIALLPYWQLVLPKWMENSQAMFSGILLGIVLGWLRPQVAERASRLTEELIYKLLKGILFIIPIFIAGFVIKMNHDQLIGTLLRNYTLIFLLIGGALFSYILLLYLVVNRFQWKPFLNSLKNMLPAVIAGFGSMSSAAALPLTLIGTEKSAKNKDLAKSIIPATCNVHLMGDCFAIPIFAFAILKSFGFSDPSFATYLLFAGSFVMAKFSVAAIPGGGILVMLPILESHLGLNAEMLSLITALYILFDPVITSANVLGNGAFAIGMSNLLKGKQILPTEDQKVESK